MPVATVTAAALAVVIIESSEAIEANFRWMFALVAVVLAVLFLLIWFMFLSGVRWRVRLSVFVALVIAAVGLGKMVRYDGSANGAALPRIAWKWTPKRNGDVGKFQLANPVEHSAAVVAAMLDYPGFLGAKRDGMIEGVRLESDWLTHPPQPLWRQPIGLGWSAFAVSGSSAVTQEQRGDREVIVSYELTSGKTFWVHTNQVHFKEQMGGDGPRATPTIAGGRVYALGAAGMLDCLDLSNGTLYWSRDTLKERNIPVPIFGKASSPLVLSNLVVVSGGPTNAPSLLAYRRDTGAPAWQAGTNDVGYTSPTLATLAARQQILSLTVGHATAHDPTDGHILWDFRWKSSDKTVIASQPVVLDGDRVFLSAGFFGAGCALLHTTTNSAGQFQVEELWKSTSLKTHFSTAVVRDGFAYGLDDGILACVDLSNGKRQWKDGRYGRGQLLRAGDLLLIQNESGPVVLVEASPTQFHELARLDALQGKTWNNPALAGEFLLVRNDQEAACYRLPLRQVISNAPTRLNSASNL